MDLISRQAALYSYQYEVCNKVRCYECKATDEDGTCKLERWIKDLPSAKRWIPVTERLPEEHEEVLTYNPVFGITFDSIHNGKWRKHPVAWMPLPEPYKGGEQNG